jgi:hypothetical protein
MASARADLIVRVESTRRIEFVREEYKVTNKLGRRRGGRIIESSLTVWLG